MKFLTLLILLFSLQIMAQSDFEKAENLFQQEKYDQAKTLFVIYLKASPSSYKTIE
ncbi:MAG: hypothetical protein WCJ62_04525 [Flavobacterium sp.]